MGSVLAHLFDTLPFACALADMVGKHRISLERMPPQTLREYIRYCHQDDIVVQGFPGTLGYRADDPTLKHARAAQDLPQLPPEDAWVWGWHSQGTRVTNADCRARGNGRKLQRVLELVEFGRHQQGRTIIPEIRVTTAQGDVLTLPLAPAFLHSKWHVGKGDMQGGSHWLWPLPANLDSAVVAAYAYDVMGPSVTPYGRSAADAGDRALDTYNSASGQDWMGDALGGNFMHGAATDHYLTSGSHAAEVNRPPAVFVVGPPRILVVLSFSVFKERADVEPGGLLGMTKVHPHIMVRSSLALTRVEAAVRGQRPANTTVLDGGDPRQPGACCHSDDTRVRALFVNDNNLVNTDAAYNYPLLTYWSTVFSYIEVNPEQRFDGQMLKMVRRDLPGPRAWTGVGQRLVPNLFHPGTNHVETGCEKEPRQGEFDNIHMAPRLSLAKAAYVQWSEERTVRGRAGTFIRAQVPSAPYALTPANRGAFHLEDIAMAPVCEHDCFHFHWRWLKGSTQPWTKGWSEDGPHSRAGATMVPLNQDVEVAIDGPHGFIYRATATPADGAPSLDDNTRIIPPLEWQVFMHHGCAYAQDFVHDLTGEGVAASIAVWGGVSFLDADRKVIDGAKDSGVLYWNYRYYIDVVNGEPIVRPRLDVEQGILDYVRVR